MAQILLVVGIFSVAIVGMAISLHFSKYKQRPSGCCGGTLCKTKGHSTHKEETHNCYKEKLNYLEELKNS